MVAPESEHVDPPTVDDWEPTLPSSPPPLQPAFTEQHTIVIPTSSPSPDFDYEIATKFAVYVNGSRKVKDTVPETTRSAFSFSDLEDTVESLVASPASTVDSRPFEYVGRTVRAKISKPRAIWQDFNLQDFSDSEGSKIWTVMDALVLRSSRVTRVELSVEIRISVKAQAKVFVRTAVDPSSDPPVATTQSRTRTNQLLKENELIEKRERLRTKIDLISHIHKYWACRVAVCENYGRWCYVHHSTHEHFEIRESEAESFALAILNNEPSVSVMQPPLQLVNLWQTRLNKLTINPHNKRARGSKKQRTMSSSSDDNSKIMKMMQQQQKFNMQNQLLQMQGQANSTLVYPPVYPSTHPAAPMVASARWGCSQESTVAGIAQYDQHPQ